MKVDVQRTIDSVEPLLKKVALVAAMWELKYQMEIGHSSECSQSLLDY